MNSPNLRVLALAAALSVVALSGAQAQATAATDTVASAVSATDETRARPARRSRDVITAEEIAGATDMDAYALINRLRSPWLRKRGTSSLNRPERVQVHINGNPETGFSALRQLRVADIMEIRHLDGIAATQRFGTDYGAGVILVRTR